MVYERYQRLSLLEGWNQKIVFQSQVLVIGCGALGNEVLKNLALVGLGKIYICDFDTIEMSNLCKSVLFRDSDVGKYKVVVAKEKLTDINPGIEVTPIVGEVWKIGLGLFAKVDLVFGCIDNKLARQEISRACFQVGTPYIDGCLQGRDGSVRIMLPDESPCYDCTLNISDQQELRTRRSCGMITAQQIKRGIISTSPITSSIISAIQVQEGLKILHQQPVEHSKTLVYYGRDNTFQYLSLNREKNCPWHNPPIDYVLIDEISRMDPFRKVIEKIQDHVKFAISEVGLVRDYVDRFYCRYCDVYENTWLPIMNVTENNAVCPRCGKLRCYYLTHSINCNDEISKETTQSLLPESDIIYLYNPVNEEVLYFLIP